jgi:branched-chain amino acid transport system substrate-binding protein
MNPSRSRGKRGPKLQRAAYTLVGTALIGMTACGGSSSTPSNGQLGGTINVGVIAALTGQFFQFGAAFEQGAELAASVINSDGGILGAKLNVHPVDDGGDAVDAVTAARQLLAIDNVKAVIGPGGEDWQDVLPILNAAPMVTMAHIGTPAVLQGHFAYVFNVLSLDSVTGAAMAYWAAQKGYHRIALAFDNTTNSQTLVPSLQHAAGLLGLTVVANPTLPSGVLSYEAQVQQILASKPDAILTQLTVPNAGPFFHELYSAGGTNIPLIGSDADVESAFVTATGPLAKNFQDVQGGTNTSGPQYAAFLSEFQNKFHTTPNYAVVSIFDAMNVVALAMADAKSSDPATYVKDIMDVTTPGPDVTTVTSYAQGARLLAEGKKIKYLGISSPMTFDSEHQVGGPYEVVQPTASGTQTSIATIAATALQPYLG